MRNEDHSDFTDQRFDLVLVISTLHELRLQSILGQYSLYYAHRVQTDNDGDSRARLNELYGFQVSRIRKDIIGVLRKLIDRKKSVSVLDIGCGFAPYLEDLPDDMNGKVSFTFLDKDENLREALKSKFPSSRFIQCDLLTQISISEGDADNKRKYFLKTFFYFISKKLNVNGILFLSEFYYPRYLKTNEIDAMIGLLRCHVGHGDPTEAFYLPENVNKEAHDLKFSLLEQVDFAPIPLTSNIQWIPPKELLELSKRRYFRSIYCKEEDIDSGSNETKLIKEDSSVEYEGQIAEDITAIRKATKDGLWAAFLKQDKEQDVRKLLDKVVGNEGTDGWRLANSANKIIYWWKEFGRNTRNKVSSFSYLSIWISVTSILSRIFDKEGKCKRFDPLKDGLPCGYFYRMTESSSNESHKEENQPIALGLEKEISYIAYNYLLSKQLTVAENNATGKSINALILDRNKSGVSDDQIKSVAFVCEPEYKIGDSFSARQASILNLCRGRSGKHYTIYCSFSNTESASYLFSANGPQIAGGSGGDKTLSAFLMGKPQSECNDCEKTEYQMLITFLDFLFLGYRIGTNKFSQYEGELAEFITRTRSRFEEVGLHAVYEEYDGYLKSACKEFTEYLCKIHNASSQENFPSVWLTVSLDEPGSEIPVSSVMLFSNGIVGMEFLEQRLIPLLRRPLVEYSAVENDVLNEFKDAQLKISNIRSAIGSIMSRNGSHNIGSHVLAALSHNVGTMPDDRVLYQYIQHRMDYIATATTEFPTWRQPMLFVSSVMKQFMMQKHLLNFISRSEGLQAYQFQNPALTASTQPNTIRLHVRRIHDEIKDWEGRGKYSESEYDNFIPYGNEKAGSFERDILVAIPGGVIGQHAFYTIIENILRNAAKHEWATAKIKNDHLDVYIDFHDNPNEGVVEFQVWNDRVNKDKETSDDRNISSLVKTLAERMSASFIDNEGGLRKENWGLAEMRISAGFLRGSDVSLVGGIGVGQKEMLGLIRPLVVGNGEGKECLGYRFDLHKPRELLVVLPNKYCEGKGAKFTADKIISLNKMLSQYGVNVMPESEAEKSKGLAYSYVLFDSFNGKVQGRYNLPFRVLSAGDVINLTNEQTGVCVIARFCGDSFEGVLKKLESISCNINDGPNRKTINELLEQIYSSWLMHVRNQRDDTRIDPDAAKLVIDSKDDGGGGKSLFANANLLYFIFENSFNSAVRSYLSMHTPRTLNPSIAGTLYALTKLSPRKQFSARELSDRAKDNASMMIQLQLIEWGRVAKDNVNVQNGYIGLEANGMDLPSEDEWGGAGAWKNSFCEWKSNCVASAYLDGLTNRSSSTRGAIIEFIKYLAGPILEQARSYLAKYEERYVTLPRLFGVSQKPREEDEATWENGLLKQGILFTSKDEEKISHAKNSAICYWRHGDKDLNDGLMAVREKALYFEPLSGAQSYLSALTELSNDLIAVKDKNVEDGAGGRRINAIRFMTGLVENGIMRVLIMDERTKKFADEHPDVASIFESTRICVLGGEEDVVARLFQDFFEKRSAAFNEKINGVSIRDWEILIIHQGIIDKMFDGLDKKTTIEYFYAWLKKNMRYVVITTGRGAPPNIPSDVRVLPFSVIENTLFKRYPEKLLLVDTIMNILPIGERNTL